MSQFEPVKTSAGRVTLVGAGPGDPGLLTLAGREALGAADAVLYDALSPMEVLSHCRPWTELVPVGKRAGAHSMSQEEINALIVEKAMAGKRVVRLKGGDPFVFGRGGEEALACREAGIEFSVVPGVTAAVAVPAYAGIPLTHRGLSRNFAVVTGSEAGESETDWAALAKLDTVVILMGATTLDRAAESLIAAGRDPITSAAAISSGTLPIQRTVVATLGTIAEAVRTAELPTPLITVIGEVAGLSEELAWRVVPPLAGKSVVVTRTRTQASELRAMLEALGADVVEAPVLEIVLDATELKMVDHMSSRWDWAVFTSQNAVASFFEALENAGKDARVLGGTLVAAVGMATASALRERGVIADFLPSVATGECLAAELPRAKGARILVGAGSLNGPALSDGLRARGGQIEEVVLYRTMPATLDEALRSRVLGADAITFASASSARFLRQALGERELSHSVKLCAIGAQAAAAVAEAFGREVAIATEPSIGALAAAVVEALA